MSAYVPPGWPPQVHPPGSERFEETATAWLFDVVPPDYRTYGVLRRHPAVLARMARQHVEAAIEAARRGYRGARTEFGAILAPHAIDAVLEAYRREGTRLVGVARGIELLELALRGVTFTPRQRDHDR